MVKPKGTTRNRKLIYGIWLSSLVLPLCCLSFDLRYLLVPFDFSIVLSVLWFTVSGCVVCPLIYGFWLSPLVLPLWYLSFDIRYHTMEKSKGTSRYRKSKDRQHNGKTKEGNQIPLIKGQTRQPGCVVCPLIYGIWLAPLVLPLCCLSFDLRYVVAPGQTTQW
jgi:hypothetical protein